MFAKQGIHTERINMVIKCIVHMHITAELKAYWLLVVVWNNCCISEIAWHKLFFTNTDQNAMKSSKDTWACCLSQFSWWRIKA